MKHTLTLLAALLCSAALWAHDFVVDGIFYKVISSTSTPKTAGVTYKGDISQKSYNTDRYIGDIVVPATVEYQGETYKVVRISDGAFYNCSQVTSVTLPEGITLIELHSFNGCKNLKQITLPSTLTTIKPSVFPTTGLTSFHIPKDLRSIERYAFTNCMSLTTITIDPENEHFEFINGLLINKTDKTLVAALYTDDVKGEVIIPEGVEKISDGAFGLNKNITSVKIPASLKGFTTGENPFYGCTSLSLFEVDPINTDFKASEDGKFLLSKNGANLWCCAGSVSGEVIVPDGVKNIKFNAFRRCDGITSIICPESLTTLTIQAFYQCTNLESVVLPMGVKTIPESAFKSCSKLTEITMDGVKTIDKEAFAGTGFTSITLPNNLTTISDRVFSSCSNLTTVILPESIQSLGSNVFNACKNLKSISVDPEADIVLDGDILYTRDKTKLIMNLNKTITSVEIPEGVTIVDGRAFSDCDKLTSVKFPTSLKEIGAYAFNGCTKLTDVTLKENVEEIGMCAFYGCKSIVSMSIPNTTNSIGFKALYGCDALAELTMGENDSYTLEDGILYSKLKGTIYRCLVSKEGEVDIPESVSVIEATAFRYCTKITSVNIPAHVAYIGDQAFNACYSLSQLTVDAANKNFSSENDVLYNKDKSTLIVCAGGKTGSLSIPESVTTITAYAFRDCKIENVTIPGTLKSVGDNAFYYAKNITELNLGEGITSIGANAFYACSKLKTLTLPASLSSLGASAFKVCTNLKTINCQRATAPTVGSSCFSSVPASATVNVLCGAAAKYQKATGWKDFSNIKEPEFEFAFSAVSGDEEMGSVEISAVPDCSSSFASFAAVPAEDYQFVEWSDGDKNAERVLEVTEDVALTALFQKTPKTQGTEIETIETEEVISVKGNTICGPAAIEIINLAGQDVTEQNGNLSAGIYIVRCGEQTIKVRVF